MLQEQVYGIVRMNHLRYYMFYCHRNRFRKAFKQFHRVAAVPAIQRTNWVFRKLSAHWIAFAKEIKMKNGKWLTAY